MSSPGSPEAETPPTKRPGLGVIGLSLILVVLGAMIGVQVLGVLYGILFPPSPPILESFNVITHTSPSYGVDDWLYASADDACRVVRYYESQGAECRVAPGVCGTGFAYLEGTMQGFNVARCTNEIEWSIFQQRYYINIASGYGEQNPTRIRLEREIFWTGVLPGPRADTNFGTPPTAAPESTAEPE